MKKIKEMTLKEKIGQLLIAGFNGYEENEHLDKLIEHNVGNIILFRRNVSDAKQLSKLNHVIHEKIKNQTGVIPLIAIDQEGGIVTRIMKDASFCPGAMTLSATNPENARKTGEIMSEELSRLGINYNLAPVLDVNNNPLNPVIGIRSYSDDPTVVAKMGTEFIFGMQKDGLLATAKHFPGHGDVIVDSHLGLPIITHSLKRIHNVELVPFKKAIKEGVSSIMSAHIFFSSLEENNRPATLSKKILTNLLREELAFEGIIVSDCMEMKAISDTVGTAKGSVEGIIAGLDLVCISHTLEKQLAFLTLMEEAVKEDRISEKEIDEKVERIFRAKKKTFKILEKNFFNNPNNVSYFPNKENNDFVYGVVEESLTLFKGERFILKDKTLLLATNPFATTIAEDEVDGRNIIEAVSKKIPEITCLKMDINKFDQGLINEIENYDTVIVCTYNAATNKNQARLVNTIINKAKRVFIISIRNPYDYLVLNNVQNYLSLYEYTPNAVNALVEYLKGNVTPKGVMPISLKRRFDVFASVYVGLAEYSQSENFEYMKFLKENNVETVFISGHMPEVLPGFLDDLKETIDYANELGLKVILDVSKKTLDETGIPKGIYSLRLDYGFNANDVLELLKEDFYVEINASITKDKEIEFLISQNADFSKLRISHNFYPKKYTGLSHEDVRKRNELYKSLGLKIMAYVPSVSGKRPPMFEGLPTIEEHRNLDLYGSLADLAMLEIDEVCFGDAYCNKEELEIALNYDRDLITIPLVVFEGISEKELEILNRTHANRRDENPYFIRSSFRTKETIEKFNTTNRLPKMVTIDNEGFLRYQGEVGIMRTSLPKDERVNVVGKALISDFLLKNIKAGQRFRFMIRGVEKWKE